MVTLYFVDVNDSKTIGSNPNTLGCIFRAKSATIKSAKENKKEAEPIDNEPIIVHISRMLRDLKEEPLRAVYMVVEQMHRLQGL